MTLYTLCTKKARTAIDYLMVPIAGNIPEFQRMLTASKKTAEPKRQERFNRVFALVVFNLLVDQLITFETALALRKHTKSVDDALECYSYLWHNSNLSVTSKAVFELLLSDPVYEQLFSNSVGEVIWMAQEIRRKTKSNSSLEQTIRQLMANLGAAKRGGSDP